MADLFIYESHEVCGLFNFDYAFWVLIVWAGKLWHISTPFLSLHKVEATRIKKYKYLNIDVISSKEKVGWNCEESRLSWWYVSYDLCFILSLFEINPQVGGSYEEK